jgi:hypothetical protein
MKKLAAWAAVLATALAAPCVAGQKPKAPDYYPLKPGTKWHYRVTTNGRTGTFTNQISKIEKIDDLPLARLEAIVNDKVVASEHLRSDDKGVYRHRFNGLESKPAIQLLRYPVKDGDTWETDFVIGTEKGKAVTVVGKEEVKVPAGTYQTVRVRVDTDSGGQKISTTYWFADGIGFVKQAIDLGGRKTVLELEKYEPAK